MLLIKCPWCGAREQTEFSHHGEAHIVRPVDPDALSDEEWGAYLFSRKNPKGVHYERWMHAFGCRRFFNMARHTVSGEIYGVYPMGGEKPATALATETAETAQKSVAAERAAADLQKLPVSSARFGAPRS